MGTCTEVCRVLVSAPGTASVMEAIAVILTEHEPSKFSAGRPLYH